MPFGILVVQVPKSALHEWYVEIVGWRFGLEAWDASDYKKTLLYFGRFELETGLSRYAVAGIAVAILLIIVGIAAYVIRGRGRPA
jgi:hypothetical protein